MRRLLILLLRRLLLHLLRGRIHGLLRRIERLRWRVALRRWLSGIRLFHQRCQNHSACLIVLRHCWSPLHHNEKHNCTDAAHGRGQLWSESCDASWFHQHQQTHIFVALLILEEIQGVRKGTKRAGGKCRHGRNGVQQTSTSERCTCEREQLTRPSDSLATERIKIPAFTPGKLSINGALQSTRAGNAGKHHAHTCGGR